METLFSLLNDWLIRHRHKTFLILGFGLEGQSTYRFLSRYLPESDIYIMDLKPEGAKAFLTEQMDDESTVMEASEYMAIPDEADCIFKSPGIPFKTLPLLKEGIELLSQTDVFLEVLGHKTIGITGTKGKSTTASLAWHLLKEKGLDAALLGNIGLPAFEMFEEEEADWYVFELSSHQLETVGHSPHVAMLLNLFQEHLDHYRSYGGYRDAKLNIGRYQQKGDFFIFDKENEDLAENSRTFEGEAIGIAEATSRGYTYDTVLPGRHNRRNIDAVLLMLEKVGIEVDSALLASIAGFSGLKHRLETVGTWKGITFVNDSISTIPQATIAAIESFDNVETVIFGGMDRGIDYHELVDYLNANQELKLIMLPDTGHKLMDRIENDKRKHRVQNMEEAVEKAYAISSQGTVCLLSPAAASYGFYRNFEERGDDFAYWVQTIGGEQ